METDEMIVGLDGKLPRMLNGTSNLALDLTNSVVDHTLGNGFRAAGAPVFREHAMVLKETLSNAETTCRCKIPKSGSLPWPSTYPALRSDPVAMTTWL